MKNHTDDLLRKGAVSKPECESCKFLTERLNLYITGQCTCGPRAEGARHYPSCPQRLRALSEEEIEDWIARYSYEAHGGNQAVDAEYVRALLRQPTQPAEGEKL